MRSSDLVAHCDLIYIQINSRFIEFKSLLRLSCASTSWSTAAVAEVIWANRELVWKDGIGEDSALRMMVMMMMMIILQLWGSNQEEERKKSKSLFQALVCLWSKQANPGLLCRQVRGDKSFFRFQCLRKQLHLFIFSIATRANYICVYITSSNYICSYSHLTLSGESEGGHLLPLDLRGIQIKIQIK